MEINHFILSELSEPKITGHYPQVEGFIKGYDPTSEFGIFKIPLFELPSFEPNLDGIKLYKRAKLTDIISAVGMFHRGIIIHKRIVEILKNFNICKHRIYETKLYQNENILDDYRVLIAEFDIFKFIDYEKTEFYSFHGPTQEFREKLKIDNEESYNKTEYDVIHGPEGIYRYMVKNKGPIYLRKDFTPKLDYFVAQFIGTVISERLKNALEDNKVTGVWFKELGDKLIFQ